jgi:hypothetical protein
MNPSYIHSLIDLLSVKHWEGQVNYGTVLDIMVLSPVVATLSNIIMQQVGGKRDWDRQTDRGIRHFWGKMEGNLSLGAGEGWEKQSFLEELFQKNSVLLNKT